MAVSCNYTFILLPGGFSHTGLGKNLLRFRHNPFEGCKKTTYFAIENKKQQIIEN